jgi:glycosyltransferase involved in cell wall biosynthesis
MAMKWNKKLSILMLTHDSWVDRRILSQADSLRQQGATVTILAMPLNHNNACDNDAPFITRLNLTKRADAGFFYRITYASDQVIKKIFGKGRHIRLILRSLFWRLQSSPETYYKKLFLKKALEIPADIYVAHDLPLLPVAHFCAKKYSSKLVYDSHELYCSQEFSSHEQAMWKAVESKYIHDCDKVITINHSIATELCKQYGINNVEVVHNAEKIIHSNEHVISKIKTQIGIKKDIRILLYQGSITEQHNLEVLVDAISLLDREDLHLLYLGDGPYVKTLKKYINKKQLSSKIHYHPAVSQDKLMQYTVVADIGIIPYQPTCLNNYLCTPNKLFEYISAGLPIIATDLPELRKFVHNNQIGLVGNTSAAIAIAHMLSEMLEPQSYAFFKKNVIALREKIDWETEAATLIKIYQDL